MLNNLIEESKYLKSIVEINKLKNNILKELNLPNSDERRYKAQLNEYIFVNDLEDLKPGTFLRCIKMDDSEYTLSSPCIFCDVKMTDSGTLLLCRQVWNAKLFFHLSMEKTVLFRKLKTDEKLFLALALKS
jgi:hypothetical protein